jgi:hypothetical protein
MLRPKWADRRNIKGTSANFVVSLMNHGSRPSSDRRHEMSGAGDATTKNEWLSRVLGFATGTTPGGKEQIPANTGVVAYAKSRLAWLAARQQVQSEIDALRDEVIATFEEDGNANQHAAGYSKWVSPVLENFDTALADTLDAAVSATDPAQHAKLVEDAKEIIKRYEGYLGSPLIEDIESNPFRPVSIREPIAQTLAQLSQTIR